MSQRSIPERTVTGEIVRYGAGAALKVQYRPVMWDFASRGLNAVFVLYRCPRCRGADVDRMEDGPAGPEGDTALYDAAALWQCRSCGRQAEGADFVCQ